MSAEDLGKRLLAEVEEVGLDEILNDLRLRDDNATSTFNLPPVDNILQFINETRTSSGKPQITSPIIELMTLHPDTGASHLLYHLAALAVLPTNLRGRQSCALIIDADNTFSLPRLVREIKDLAFSTRNPEATTTATTTTLNETIHQSLKHIHIFHPQSLPSTIATITSLSSYLFDATRHSSFDRPVSLIALHSASSFHWQARSDAEDAALLAHTSRTPQPSPPGYTHLAAALKNASRTLHAPVVYTTRCPGPGKNNFAPGFAWGPRSFRPSLPPPWGTMATVRLVVRRVAVRKLPVGITAEQARREDAARRDVVEKGKFELLVNEWGLDEGLARKLQDEGADGFEFCAGREGFWVEVETSE